MNLSLKDKNAIVCGSTQGIGKAIAIELALLGASVTLVARNEEKLQATTKELSTTEGQQHDYLVADFSNPEELEQKIGSFLASKSAVHILINNTGGPAGGPIIEASTKKNAEPLWNHRRSQYKIKLEIKNYELEIIFGRSEGITI